MAFLLAVGQHADADAQRLDQVQPAGRHRGFGTSARACRRAAARPAAATAASFATSGVAFPQEHHDALETACRGQLLDGVAAHDQPAGLAINLGVGRIGHDDAVKPTIHPVSAAVDLPFPLWRKIQFPEIFSVDLDYMINMMPWRNDCSRGSGAASGRVSGDTRAMSAAPWCAPRPFNGRRSGASAPTFASLKRRRDIEQRRGQLDRRSRADWHAVLDRPSP